MNQAVVLVLWTVFVFAVGVACGLYLATTPRRDP